MVKTFIPGISTILVFFLVLTLPTDNVAVAEEAEKPNVILILVDNLGNKIYTTFPFLLKIDT